MASASTRSIETLNRSNYDTWCLQAQAVLIKNDLWDYVSGENKLSSTSTAVEQKAFAKGDIQARSELILLISPTELKQIKGCQTSKEVWDKLKSIHQSTGPARKATLLKQLVLKKMNSQEDIRDHLNNFLDVVGKLGDMDVTIHPELLSIMMLYSLPANYENFRIAIESRDVLPNPEELKVKIIEENEARRQIDTIDNPQMSRSEALYAKQKKKIVICKNCNKKGHTTEACWSKKGATNPQKPKHREKNFNICFSLEEKSGDNLWCLDSGCSSHMTGKGYQFINLTPEVNTLTLAAKKHTTQIKGKGKISISSNNDNYNLNDTLYVPEISTNLMSVGKITDNGYKVLFEKDKASIIEADTVVLQASRNTNGLYYLDFEENETANLTEKSQDESLMWHRKLGHINEEDLKMIVSRQMMSGLNLKEVKLDTCETCIKGKLSSLPFPSHDRISSQTLEIIHSDVCGPFEDESLAGSRYYVSFIDDFSRYCCIYFIKNKSEVIEKFKEYINGVELFTKKKIQYLQSDNGGEYRRRNI